MGRYNGAKNNLYLRVEDAASGIEFLNLEFQPEELANLLNQSIAYMEGHVKGLENVGKKYVSENVQFPIPKHISTWKKSEIKEWLETEIIPQYEAEHPGRTVSRYIDSQSSIQRFERGTELEEYRVCTHAYWFEDDND